MIDIRVTLEQRGPSMVSTLKAQADSTSTEAELAAADEFGELFTKWIADQGGSGRLIRNDGN